MPGCSLGVSSLAPREPRTQQVRTTRLPDAQPASLDTQLRNFFDEFSRSSNALDLATLGRCFDEVFLAADATGTKVVPRPAFLQALPRDVIYGTSMPLGPCSAWPPLTGRTAPTGRLFAQPLPAGHLSAPLAVGVSSYTILQVDTTMAAAQR